MTDLRHPFGTAIEDVARRLESEGGLTAAMRTDMAVELRNAVAGWEAMDDVAADMRDLDEDKKGHSEDDPMVAVMRARDAERLAADVLFSVLSYVLLRRGGAARWQAGAIVMGLGHLERISRAIGNLG